MFIVEGEHLVEETLEKGIVIDIFSLEEKENSTQVSIEVMKNLATFLILQKYLLLQKKLRKERLLAMF